MTPQNDCHDGRVSPLCGLIDRIKCLVSQQPGRWDVQILEDFDRSATKGLFPYLTTDEHSAFAKARLTAFRSDREWLIAFEIISYIGEVGEFTNILYSYGNRVKTQLKWVGGLCLTHEIEDETWVPDPCDFEFSVYGEQRSFAPLPQDYSEAGIDLDQPISGDRSFDRKVQIVRLLAHILPPDGLFLDRQQILECLTRPKELPLFLRLYRWDHPDPASGEMPSDSQCLQNLARAMAANQPELCKCPADKANTHWSNWRNYFLES